MKGIALCLALAMLLFTGSSLAAVTRGTPAQAKEILEKAVAFYQANGQEKAFAEINDPKGQFVKGDVYVFVINMQGNVVAHGANLKLIGKDMSQITDSDGKRFAKEMVDVAQKSGSGSVEYKWSNPESKKIEPKITFVKKVGDVVICCGAYK